MKIREHNVETGEIIERDATAQELAQLKADATAEADRIKTLNDDITAKAALLNRLGITADEAKLLLA